MKKGLTWNKLEGNFFDMVYVSGACGKFAEIGPDRFLQYKIFYGFLDMHIYVNFSEEKIVGDIIFLFLDNLHLNLQIDYPNRVSSHVLSKK